MVDPQAFFDTAQRNGINFFTGVPDSLLKDFCAYVTDHTNEHNHVIAANEGGAVALAAGHFVATGSLALVYMQNSGQGNAVNPLMSLTHPDVFGIPMLLLIGWRGEPGTEDEPQHVKQGKITLSLLDALGVEHAVLPEDTRAACECLRHAVSRAGSTNAPFALVARTDTFQSYKLVTDVKTAYELNREEALRLVIAKIGTDAVVVGTTGKTSRELFESREASGQVHDADFRVVGCMGHASQIALGIALAQPNRRIFCLDGDGAVIMHMGALAIIGSQRPSNLTHVVFNNGAHDSVGGQPTVGFAIDIPRIAEACGYRLAVSAHTSAEIVGALDAIRRTEGPALLEIRVNKGARANLGRPTITPATNKHDLMQYLGT